MYDDLSLEDLKVKMDENNQARYHKKWFSYTINRIKVQPSLINDYSLFTSTSFSQFSQAFRSLWYGSFIPRHHRSNNSEVSYTVEDLWRDIMSRQKKNQESHRPSLARRIKQLCFGAARSDASVLSEHSLYQAGPSNNARHQGKNSIRLVPREPIASKKPVRGTTVSSVSRSFKNIQI